MRIMPTHSQNGSTAPSQETMKQTMAPFFLQNGLRLSIIGDRIEELLCAVNLY